MFKILFNRKRGRKKTIRLTWVVAVEVCVVDHPDHLYGRKHDDPSVSLRAIIVIIGILYIIQVCI